MIEMPANRTTPGAAPQAAVTESAADAPEGAFQEMLSRNLGRGLVRRTNSHHQEAGRDAAQGGAQGGTEFYQGAVITPWAATAPPPTALTSPAPPTRSAATAATDPAAVPAMTPASQAVAARIGLLASTGVASSAQAAIAPDTATAETGGGMPLDHVAAGAGAATTGQSRIDNPWQATPPQSAPTVVAPSQAAANRVVDGRVDATHSLFGEPSSGPGILDSPRLETAATAAFAGPPAAMEAMPVSPTAAAPVTIAAAAAAVTSDTRIGEPPTEPTTNARSPIEAARADAATSEAAAAHAADVPGQTARPSSIPNTQLVNRVMRMVEYQQTQPPPRMVVVDMPELEGLRLMVAVQADGKVHVAPIAGSAPPQIAETFMQAVGEALSADGFDLAEGSQQREGRDRPEPNEPTPANRRARRRRSAGLRL